MENLPKLFIGPLSKNIVDAVIEESILNNEIIGLIPSRRQIDTNNGYVNHWNSKEFIEYVRSKSDNIIIQRDHGGPLQGINDDDGYESIINDSKNEFNLIHIDPWKKYPDIQEAAEVTADLIKTSSEFSSKSFYEVGTEEAIRKYSFQELEEFLEILKDNLQEKFKRIKFAVIQSGTGLEINKNIGSYNQKKSSEFMKVCKKFKLLSKEHNGDYLKVNDIKNWFHLGLNAINIAPEFGFIETKCILEDIKERADKDSYQKLFEICYESKKWEKWIPEKKVNYFYQNNKNVFIHTACHYVFANPAVQEIINKNEEINLKINPTLRKKIRELLCAIKP